MTKQPPSTSLPPRWSTTPRRQGSERCQRSSQSPPLPEDFVQQDLTDYETSLIPRPLHVDHIRARIRCSTQLRSTGHCHLLVSFLLMYIVLRSARAAAFHDSAAPRAKLRNVSEVPPAATRAVAHLLLRWRHRASHVDTGKTALLAEQETSTNACKKCQNSRSHADRLKCFSLVL